MDCSLDLWIRQHQLKTLCIKSFCFFNKFFHNHFELTCREQFQIISQSQKFATNLNFEEQIHLLAKIGY